MIYIKFSTMVEPGATQSYEFRFEGPAPSAQEVFNLLPLVEKPEWIDTWDVYIEADGDVFDDVIYMESVPTHDIWYLFVSSGYQPVL